jgi:hypothetical protein
MQQISSGGGGFGGQKNSFKPFIQHLNIVQWAFFIQSRSILGND